MEDMQDELEELMEDQQEIQEVMSRSYGEGSAALAVPPW